MNAQIKNATLWKIAKLQIAYDKAYANWMASVDDEDSDYYSEWCYRIGSQIDDLNYELKLKSYTDEA